MATLATTKMFYKGQVVIPDEVRKRLNLKAGAQFFLEEHRVKSSKYDAIVDSCGDR